MAQFFTYAPAAAPAMITPPLKPADLPSNSTPRMGSLTQRIFNESPVKRIVLTPLTEPSECTSPARTARTCEYDLSGDDQSLFSSPRSMSSLSDSTSRTMFGTATASDAETHCFTDYAPVSLAGAQFEYSPRTPPLNGRNGMQPAGATDGCPSPFDGNMGKKLCRDYIRIEKIGQGDFGTVWKAYHMLERRYYAVKQFTKKFRGETDRQRRLQEVYALSACAGMCPYIVRYYDSWTEGNTLFVKMEYCSGGSVRRALPVGEHVWSDASLWELVFQIGMALCTLHVRDIVHLDVKMDNVYIKQDAAGRTFKLGDFGLVRFDSPEEGDVATPRSEYATSEAAWRGLNDDEGDKRYLCSTYLNTNRFWKEADVYALGLNLHELASGVPIPSSGALDAVTRNEADGLRHLGLELRTLIAAMCHTNPVQRPTAYEVVREAAKHIEG